VSLRFRRVCVIALPTVVGALALSLAPSNAAAPATTEAPSNDNFLHPLGLNTAGTQLHSVNTLTDTAGATVQPNLFSPCAQGPCRAGPPELTTCRGVRYTNTVWYRFYPDHDGQVEIRTFGIQNVITLYTLDPQTLVPDFKQCEPGSSYDSNVLFSKVRQGLAYAIQVGARYGAAGVLKMDFYYAQRSDLTVTPFRTRVVLRTVVDRPGKLKLLSLQFVGLTRQEGVSYACSPCRPGAFPAEKQLGNNTIVLSARPPPLLSARSRFLVAATSPAQIGRFKLYGIDVGTHQLYSLIEQGCVAPGVSSVTEAEVTKLALLHREACPTPAVIFAGGEYAFWESADGHLREKRYSDGQWQVTGTPVGARLDSGPAVTVHANGEQDVFWRGKNGELSESWYTSKWHGPIDFKGAQLSFAPTAGVDLQGDEDVFWRGTDEGLYEMTYVNGHWSGPLPVNAAGRIGSAPAVAVHADGQEDVFWKGTNGSLEEMWYNGIWNGPEPLGGAPMGSGPTVGLDGAGNEYVFWRGTDARLWETLYSNGHWSPQEPVKIDARLDSAPAVAVHASGEQDVFWRGAHGHLVEAWYTGRWNTVELGGGRLGSAPSVGVTGAQGAG
jgi:hypothetical protein